MKIKGLQFQAEFQPKKDYTPTQREIALQMALCGNKIWHNPSLQLVEKDVRELTEKEVLIKIGACGVF